MLTTDDLFSQVKTKDATVASVRAQKIERKKEEQKFKRLRKKKAKEDKEKKEFRSKFVAPFILIVTAVISYLIWLSS